LARSTLSFRSSLLASCSICSAASVVCGKCPIPRSETRRLLGHETFSLTGSDLGEACFPMSSAMAHELIASAHAKATAKATGAQHAPKAKAVGKKKKAGVLPIAAKCQLEAIARDPLTHLAHLTWEARAVVTFYARSFLAAGIDQSVRIAEGVRVELWPDETEPSHVMRGHAYIGKDGSPIDLYAPAEGFLGEYDWYVEHLRLCLTIGQVFPASGDHRHEYPGPYRPRDAA